MLHIMLPANTGADRHPELLADVFTCLSNVFKHLTKHVAPQLSAVLHNSVSLRAHTAAHVRQLAADAVGYLFRHTSQSGLKAAVQDVLTHTVLHPNAGKLGITLPVSLQQCVEHTCASRVQL